jgi:hypothetical protein
VSDFPDECLVLDTVFYFRADGSMTAFNGKWSDAARVKGVRKQEILDSAAGGETQIRSNAKMGKADGKVRTSAVLPRRE